ncbi:MAG TPA: transposase [Thermoanaerobaculia bacterium]
MARQLRYIPEGGALVHVTTRTIQGRYLLRPSPALNEILVGVLARAQRLYPVGVCAAVAASNHYHLILRVESSKRLADFMAYFNGNAAREISRLTGWNARVWSRRFHAIVISNEEAAQVEVLRYVLSHGAKEGLVQFLRQWPGLHCVRVLLDGEPLVGYWFDRTKEYAARLRREDFDRLKYATREELLLEPLACWEHLSPETRRKRIADLVQGIEEEAAAEREKTGVSPPGPAAVCAKHPHDRPNKLKKSPAPLFHAATRRVRNELYQMYAAFVAAFRDAAEKLRAGDLTAAFPPGASHPLCRGWVDNSRLSRPSPALTSVLPPSSRAREIGRGVPSRRLAADPSSFEEACSRPKCPLAPPSPSQSQAGVAIRGTTAVLVHAPLQ